MNIRITLSGLLLALLFGPLPTPAQIHFDSFQAVLNYADAHAIALRSAAISEQIAGAENSAAKANLLPTFGASTGYNDNISIQPTLVPAQLFNSEAPEGTFETFNFGTRYQYSISAQVQWDVLNFQKLFALQTTAKQVEASRAGTEVTRYNTYNQLASTYYALLLTREAIRIYEENALVSDSIFALARENYSQGVISEADLNLAEIKQRQDRRRLSQARNDLQQQHLQLQSQLNTNEAITITDEPGRFLLVDPTIQTAHPEVLRQQVEVKRYESLLKQNKAQRYPSVSLVYQNNRTWATNDFLGFSTANELPQQFFGIKVNLLGALGFSTRHQIKQSEWELQRQRLQLENTQLVKRQEDELLRLQLQQATNQLDDNQEILALQQRNDSHAENRYQSGIISLPERLNQYDDLLAAQDQYLQSLAALTIARYQLYIRQMNYHSK